MVNPKSQLFKVNVYFSSTGGDVFHFRYFRQKYLDLFGMTQNITI